MAEYNKYPFRSNQVILIGDTHEVGVTYKIINEKIPENWDAVHLGDGGWGFGKHGITNAKKDLILLNDLCFRKNIRLYHIIGNHDNPDVWKLPSESNLLLVNTGDHAVFPNGKKVLFIGGGVSIDRCTRIKGLSYWEDEITPALDNPEICDVVFSHDCPAEFNNPTWNLYNFYPSWVDKDVHLIDDCERQRAQVGKICKDAKVKEIYHGHFHNNDSAVVDGVFCKCLDINELYEYDATK